MTEVSHRVVYLLDFINQLINQQYDASLKSKIKGKSVNFDTLNCLMVLYYTVPIRLKSKIVASLFELMESNPEICNHDILPCFILKELVADHTGEFKLGQVPYFKQMITRLCQLWVRKLISTRDVFFEATVIAFSLFRLENSIDPKGYLSTHFWDAEIDEDRSQISLLKSKRLVEKLYFDFFNTL